MDGYDPYRKTRSFFKAKYSDADIVVLMLGTNDAHNTVYSNETFRSDYLALAGEL